MGDCRIHWSFADSVSVGPGWNRLTPMLPRARFDVNRIGARSFHLCRLGLCCVSSRVRTLFDPRGQSGRADAPLATEFERWQNAVAQQAAGIFWRDAQTRGHLLNVEQLRGIG